MSGGSSEEPKSYQYKYYINFAVLICENPITKILKIYENGSLIYDNGSTGNTRWKSMTLFDGTQTAASSTIQAEEGVANTPAFLGCSYVVFEEYALENTGNSIPNLQFIVQEKFSTTLTQAITQLMEKGGYEASRYSTSAELSTISLTGYVTTGPTSTRAALKDLMLVYDVIAYEYNSVIYFQKRSTIYQYEIDSKYLSAKVGNTGSDASSHGLTIVNLDQRTFPKEVEMTYLDTTEDLLTGSQSELKQNNPAGTSTVLQESVLCSLSPTEARDRVNTMLWQKWTENKTVSFTLPPSKFLVQEADVVLIVVGTQEYVIRLETVTTGANYLTEVSGVVVGLTGKASEAPYIGQSVPTPDARFTSQTLYTIPNLTVNMIDCGPLRSDDVQNAVYYIGQSVESGQEFLGASVYKALSVDGSYTSQYNTSLQTTSGVTIQDLEEFEGYGWDNKNTVQVVLSYGTLISRSEEEVLQGLNFCAIGDEVLGFVNATLVSEGTYELSQLMRGRRGTSKTGQDSGSNFVLLQNSELEVLSMSSSDYNTTRSFKWVATTEDISNVTPITKLFNANSIREFAPIDVAGVLSGGTWTFTWTRVTRSLWSPLCNTVQPAPDGRVYYVKIYTTSSYTDVIRIIKVENQEEATYTQAQQIADFGYALTYVRIGVSQLNTTYGIEGIQTQIKVT